MDGEWVKSLGSPRHWRYYRNIEGKRTVVIHFSGKSVRRDWPASITMAVHGQALMYSGDYDLEQALQLYKIAINAKDSTTAHRAVLAYVKMRGV